MKWWGWVLLGFAVGAAVAWIAASSRDQSAVEADAARRADAEMADSLASATKGMRDSLRLAAAIEAGKFLREIAEHDSVVAQLRRSVGTASSDGQSLRAELARAKSAADSVPVLVSALAASDAVVAGQARIIAAMDTTALKARRTIDALGSALMASQRGEDEAQASARRWKGVADSARVLVGRPARKKWLGFIPAPSVKLGPVVCVGCAGKPMTYGGGAMLVFGG